MLTAERLTAQLLAGPPAADPVAVAGRLLAIQAQDARGARLAVRSRTTGLGASDVDRALTQDRTLVVTWLNRGTLHLVRAEDYPWLQALTTPQLATGNRRRLGQEGVSEAAAAQGVAVIERALADEGPLTRHELRDRLDAVGVPTARQALVHLLMLASLRGLIVRGPMKGATQAFVLVRDWLGEPEPVDRDAALADLARRYLAGHGPASDRDLAAWAGVRLGDARAGLAAIAGELSAGEDGLMDLAGREPAAPLPPPRLLGPFDPLLHGWASREWVVGDRPGVVTSNGVFRPIALAGGRAVATWRLDAGRVRLSAFGRLARSDAAALERDAQDVTRFLAA